MAGGTTVFPTNLDSNTERNNTHEITSTDHNDHSVQIEAIEAKVGKDGSAVTTSHDYKIAVLEAAVAVIDPETDTLATGWRPISTVPNPASHDDPTHTLTFPGVDLTSVLSKGMRMKFNQTGGTNTQSLDLESGSSQYASRADTATLSITGAITIEAWIKLESISAQGTIVSKWNQDGGVKAYHLYYNTTGTLGFSYSGDGSNESSYTSTLAGLFFSDIGQWVHLACVVTPSTKAVAFYRNGVLVSSGTATGVETAIQDNNASFAIGARDVQGTPDTFLDGKIMEVRLWSVARTQAQIQDNMFHQLLGSETNLNAYWKLNNAYTDSTANANTLTGSGSPVFAADVPAKFSNTTRYGIICATPTFSTDTTVVLYMGTDYALDSTTVSSVYYSREKTPYGFPLNKDKWTVRADSNFSGGQSSPSQNTWYNLGSAYIPTPIGLWDLSYKSLCEPYESSGTECGQASTLSTGTSSETDTDFGQMSLFVTPTGEKDIYVTHAAGKCVEVAAKTNYYLNHKTSFASQNSIQIRGDVYPVILKAVCAYL